MQIIHKGKTYKRKGMHKYIKFIPSQENGMPGTWFHVLYKKRIYELEDLYQDWAILDEATGEGDPK